jgi:predicted AAA+ superfamily ATPase
MSASLLNAGPDELRRDFKTYGFLFESLVVRDLRVYAEATRATLLHYRDSSKREVDAIVDGGYGRWGAVEVKLGSSSEVIDEAAANLKSFAANVDTQSTSEPRFLAVVTATGYAHRRRDGVVVVPISTLSP